VLGEPHFDKQLVRARRPMTQPGGVLVSVHVPLKRQLTSIARRAGAPGKKKVP